MAGETGKSFNERLWRQWAQAPWHSWMKDHKRGTEVVLGVMASLPQDVTLKLLQSVRPLIVLPPVTHGRVVRIDASLLAGAHILQLDAAVLDRPAEEAMAIVAHELAHLMLPATGDPERDDLAADKLAAKWGFSLLSALERDLGKEHSRTKAIRALGDQLF